MVRIRFIIKRLPCKWDRKGSLLFSNSTYLLKFICVRRPNCVRRRHLNCDFRFLNCGCRPNSSYGFRRYNCCPNCGLNSMRNFSKANCFCCNCRLTSCSCCSMNWVCYSCRCWSCFCWWSSLKPSGMRTSLADEHIPSWNAMGGCCWARCSSGAHWFGCPCGRWLSRWSCLSDGLPRHCPCDRWCQP